MKNESRERRTFNDEFKLNVVQLIHNGYQLTSIVNQYYNEVDGISFIFKKFYYKRYENNSIMKDVINNLINRKKDNEVERSKIDLLFRFQTQTLILIEKAFSEEIKLEFIGEYIKT